MTSNEAEGGHATPFDITPAGAPDVPTLVELMREFYEESHYPLDRDWAARSFFTLLADRSLGAAWIARIDGEPAGYVVLTLRFGMEHGGLQASIDDLFVRAAHRRSGAATALLRTLVDEGHRRGVVALHVEVAEANDAAIALYRRFGLESRDDRRAVLACRLESGP
jgi:ribosomal protein S18 acetylase RimI-like enzyme